MHRLSYANDIVEKVRIKGDEGWHFAAEAGTARGHLNLGLSLFCDEVAQMFRGLELLDLLAQFGERFGVGAVKEVDQKVRRLEFFAPKHRIQEPRESSFSPQYVFFRELSALERERGYDNMREKPIQKFFEEYKIRFLPDDFPVLVVLFTADFGSEV